MEDNMIDDFVETRSRARLGFEASMVLAVTTQRVAVELGMPKERFWQIHKEVEIQFNQFLLEQREERGDL